MIYQTDPELTSVYPQIGHAGCFFMAILRALAMNFMKDFDHETVLEFYKRELVNQRPDVDPEMFVQSAQNLCDDFVGPGMVKYVGKVSAQHRALEDELLWGEWHRPGADFSHFVWMDGLGDTRDHVAYDPWSAQGSRSVAEGSLVSQRSAVILRRS